MALRSKIFTANNALAASDLNNIVYNGVVKIDTAADLASTDLASVNVVYQADVNKMRIRIGAGSGSVYWGQPFNSGSSPAVITSGGTKTTYTGNGTNGDSGQAYEVYTFTSAGSLIVATAGMADVLVVGGGGAGGDGAYSLNAAGGGGGVLYRSLYIPAATYNVVVGAGGTRSGNSGGNRGGYSEITGVLSAMGGGGGSGGDGTGFLDRRWGGSGGGNRTSQAGSYGIQGQGFDATAGGSTYGGGAGAGATNSVATGGAGITSYISGSAIEYGKGGSMLSGVDPVVPTANRGGGSDTRSTGGSVNGTAGGSGIVIVRVKV